MSRRITAATRDLLASGPPQARVDIEVGHRMITAGYPDLTQHEVHALRLDHNLADAHPHQSPSPSQRRIIAGLPALWREAAAAKQVAMEQRFVDSFLRFRREPRARATPSMPVYAASVATLIVANYLKLHRRSVSLMHPCFDNIPGIFRHMEVPTEPLEEDWLADPDTLYARLAAAVTADALCVVEPNNPTGFSLLAADEPVTRGFEELVRYARDHRKLLVLDLCFAPFFAGDRARAGAELYAVLEDFDVDYITIEDTGKAWPLQDAKVALLKTSGSLYQDVYPIYTSYLLNVSPFVLNVATAFVRDSIADGFESVSALLGRNRSVVHDALDGTALTALTPGSPVSVSWLHIDDPALDATSLQAAILQAGVYVLPGSYFFWDDPARGERYLRIALARDTALLSDAVERVGSVLSEGRG